MADSVGTGFPRTGIQEGHLHFNINSNILYMFTGGVAADESNWVQVGSGGSSNNEIQRWPYKFIGTELSIDFGVFGQMDFIVPAAGTITQWGIIIDGILTEDADMQLIFDRFGGDDVIDSVVIPSAGTNQLFVQRNIAFPVVINDMISVIHANTLDPAAHEIKINGYIDFTPA